MTGGPRAPVREGALGRTGLDGKRAGDVDFGPWEKLWAAGEKKRDRENGDGVLGRIKGNWAGPKERKEKERFLFFKKGFKQFNSNLNSREFKLELNNKQ